jgi:hypothetical protein
MAQTKQYITLDSIVNDYILETEQSIHKKYRLSQLAFRCLEQLGYQYFYEIRTVRLTMNSNQTVTLPNDYINYSKIGILNSIGEIIPLVYNANLTQYADTLSNRKALTESETIFDGVNLASDTFYNYYQYGGYSNIYGTGSGQPFVGTFKVDNDNGVILFGQDFTYPDIMLEYIASPKEGVEYTLPLQFRECVIAYLAWKDIANIPSSRRGNLGDKRDRRHEYYNERRLAIASWQPFRFEDAYQLNLQQTRLTVKS